MKQKLFFMMVLLLSIFGVRAQSNCAAPTGLDATLHVPNWHNAQLNWNAIVDSTAIDLLWSTRTLGSSIGLNAAGDFTGVVRFETSDLTDATGLSLTSVTFWPNEPQSVCTYYVEVWQGGSYQNSTFNPGTLLVEQEITTAIQTGALNTILLTTPIAIDPTQELWIGIRCNATGGYPLGASSNPTVANKGELLVMDTTWQTLTQSNLSGYNWLIIGTLSDPNNILSGYNLYKDDALVNTTPLTSTSYLDSIPTGTYTYGVTAVYGNSCESDAVTTTVVMNDYPCDNCSDSVIVGTGTSQGYNYPINTYYNYSYTQQIYTAAEIGNVIGGINCIAWQYIGSATQVKNIEVYMGNTTKSTFANSSDWIDINEMQPVYNGDITFAPGTYNNWITIPFNAPFEWDGVSNIVVAVVNNTGSYLGSDPTFLYHTASGPSTLYAQDDSSPYTPESFTSSGSTTANRNNIRFLIGDPISCRMPGGLRASEITADGATISWTGHDTDVGYELVVVPAGDDVTLGTPVSSADTFYLLTGLLDNTGYDVYVRANCSPDNSNWAMTSFRTECLSIEQLPWTENFDTYGTGSGVLPYCWKKLSTVNYPYISGNQFASGNGSLYFYGYTNNYSCAILPRIASDIYALNTLQISFKARKTSSTYGHIQVGIITDPTDSSTFIPIKTIDGSMYSGTNVWDDFIVYLNSYQGPDGYIALLTPGAYTSYVYVDDIVVDVISGCGSPTNLEVSQIAGSSAYLTWRESELFDASTIYNIEYTEQGMDNWITATPNGTTCLLSGLQPGTNYDVILYVTCDNGISDTLSASFRTGCLAGGDITIGNGTNTSSYLPFHTNYNYALSQQLFTAAEMGGVNTLSGIKFHIATPQSTTRNIDIYLSNTSQSSLSTSSYIPVTAQEKVFSGTVSTGVAGWLEISFDTVFAYTGGNLVLTVDDNTGSYVSSSQFSTHSITGTSIYDYDDYTNYDPTSPSPTSYFSALSSRNNVIFLGDCDSLATCVAPNLFAGNITSTTADIFWAPGYQESEWELEYKLAADSVWISEGTITQTSYTLSYLSAGSEYEVRVRSVCSSGEYSNYSLRAFATPCEEISILPYTENFDSTATNTLPDCWQRLRTSTGNYPYVSSSQSTTDGGNSLYMYNGGSSYYAIAVLPQFAADIEMDSLLISFYTRSSSTSYRLELGIMSDPTDAGTFTSIGTIQPSITNVWERQDFYTRNYTGNGHYVAFRSPIGTSNTIYLDEINIDAIPLCPHVEDLAVSSVDNGSVTLTWNPGSTESVWEVVVLPAGPVDWDTVYNINMVYASTYTEYNLQPTTEYSAYVRANCDAGDISAWYRIDFTTTQIPAQLPYTCDFEDANPGWGFYNAPGTNQWHIGTAVNNGGTKSMYISNNNGTSNTYGSTTSNNWAFRDIFFPASTSGYIISFDWKAQAESCCDYLNVHIGEIVEITASNCTNYNTGFSGTVKMNNDRMNQQSTFTTFNYTLPGYSTDGVRRIYFAWHNDGSVQYDPPAAIDNLMISEITCPIPSGLAATNITTTTADLSWTENGTATEWVVYYKANTDTIWNETFAYSTTYQLTGLQPDVTYNARVVSDCGNGTDMSPFSNTAVFTTLPTCPAPSNLTSTGNTSTTVDISWTAGGTETSWVVAYKTSTDDWSNATEDIVTATTHTITGLTAATEYQIRVKAVCDVGDESSWTNMISVTPGSYNMSASGTANITSCGMIIYDDGGANGAYSTNVNSTLTINPENPGEYVVISGNYDLENSWDDLYVYDGTTTSGTLLGSYTGTGTILDTSITGSITLHFTSDGSVTYDGFAITVSCSPVGADNGGGGGGGDTEPCNAPTNVTAIAGTTTASISWNAGGTEDAWIVEYKLATASNWSSSPTLSTTTYDITGLTPSSNYQVRVKAICSSDNESDWSNMATFTTLNEDVATYTITATATGPGTIAPNGTVTVQEGSDVTFSFTADDGAIVSQLLVDDAETAIPSNNEYTFSAVVANHTIAVTFEEEGDDTGIEEINLDNAVVLFPNPATSHIEIRVQDGALTNASLEIFDVYGRKVATQTMNNNAIQVDISGYAAGMYLVRISNENGVVVKNFIKK